VIAQMRRACSDCPDADCRTDATPRRAFLARGIAVVTLALTGTGLDLDDALALPVAFAAGAPTAGTERAFAIPAADGVVIDRAAQVIVVRYQNRVYAFALSCPHQNTALKWLAKDGRFQCPKHDSKYRPDGTFLEGRATRNMDRFAVRRDNATLIVDLAKWFQSDRDAAGWAGAHLEL
jgi:nitrite reductase/ring-hydroxylating ferredoxin subunit